MNTEQDELQRFQNVVTESLMRFLSQDAPERSEAQQEMTNALLMQLPAVSEKELEQAGHKDSICSICMQSFLAILAEEETASAMESPALFTGELGVTKLNQPWQCGHLFCRRDITKWLKTGKLTCPMCRKSLVEPGSQAEQTQAQESELPGWSDAEFRPGAIIDFRRMFSRVADATSNRASDHQSSEESRESHNDYAGMYS